jgi:hypothetical protein
MPLVIEYVLKKAMAYQLKKNKIWFWMKNQLIKKKIVKQ